MMMQRWREGNYLRFVAAGERVALVECVVIALNNSRALPHGERPAQNEATAPAHERRVIRQGDGGGVGGNLHFLAKARDPAAALAHAEEVVPGVEGALQQRRARLRLEQLEHAAEGEEDGTLLDRGFVGVGGLLI